MKFSAVYPWQGVLTSVLGCYTITNEDSVRVQRKIEVDIHCAGKAGSGQDGRVRAGVPSLNARLQHCPQRLLLDAEVDHLLTARSAKVCACSLSQPSSLHIRSHIGSQLPNPPPSLESISDISFGDPSDSFPHPGGAIFCNPPTLQVPVPLKPPVHAWHSVIRALSPACCGVSWVRLHLVLLHGFTLDRSPLPR